MFRLCFDKRLNVFGVANDQILFLLLRVTKRDAKKAKKILTLCFKFTRQTHSSYNCIEVNSKFILICYSVFASYEKIRQLKLGHFIASTVCCKKVVLIANMYKKIRCIFGKKKNKIKTNSIRTTCGSY